MANLNEAIRHFKPSEIHAYLDTVELFIPRQQVARVGEDEQFEGIRIIPCRTRKGFVIGARLVVNGPDALTLQRLDRVMKRYGGILCRCDVAVDIQMASSDAAELMKDWIVRHAVLRWRRTGPMVEYSNGAVYWVRWKKRHRRYPRNLVIYADKPNRHTGELDCVHLELRFLNAASVKRQGIASVSDLMSIDPNVLVSKHVKFSDAGDSYVTNFMRKAVKADRQWYQQHGQHQHHHAYTDLYRAHIAEKGEVDLASDWFEQSTERT